MRHSTSARDRLPSTTTARHDTTGAAAAADGPETLVVVGSDADDAGEDGSEDNGGDDFEICDYPGVIPALSAEEDDQVREHLGRLTLAHPSGQAIGSASTGLGRRG